MLRATGGQRRGAPGRIVSAALLAVAPLPVLAQQPPSTPASAVPIPSPLEVNKLIWSTMAAVDHANQAGNYSVLRDLAAPNFQVMNDAARLTAIFQSLRASGVDLSNTLLLAPTLTATPRVLQPGVIQFQGVFGLRPTAIQFDLIYQWSQGKWRLFGVSIAPTSLTSIQPRGSPPPPRPRN